MRKDINSEFKDIEKGLNRDQEEAENKDTSVDLTVNLNDYDRLRNKFL